ncbi:MAG: hypothetical protein FWG10_11980 [Eubacteriaceae bacterium]|nr:hypothetical protein [Eubacteriaceae bacterium]
MLHQLLSACKHILVDMLKELFSLVPNEVERIWLGRMANAVDHGGQALVSRLFPRSKEFVAKGQKEAKAGKASPIASGRGRKGIEAKHPNLVEDIHKLMKDKCSADPRLKGDWRYSGLTIREIRAELIGRFAYTSLPGRSSLHKLVNRLGYRLKTVEKTKHPKRAPGTDAIFGNLDGIHECVENSPQAARISADCKDKIRINGSSRGGKSRIGARRADHDFGHNAQLAPFGIYNVITGITDVFMTLGRAAADFMAGMLQKWRDLYGEGIKKLLQIDLDNGPGNSMRRRQRIKRMLEFAHKNNVFVVLAYYPPYLSKYNPIEHVWGSLERHWNGFILDSIEAALGYASAAIYNGNALRVAWKAAITQMV